MKSTYSVIAILLLNTLETLKILFSKEKAGVEFENHRVCMVKFLRKIEEGLFNLQDLAFSEGGVENDRFYKFFQDDLAPLYCKRPYTEAQRAKIEENINTCIGAVHAWIRESDLDQFARVEKRRVVKGGKPAKKGTKR